MPFVTIRIVTPLGEYHFSQGRQHSLLRRLQALLELELKQDFETGAVVLRERDDGQRELVANVTGPREGQPLTEAEQVLLARLNEVLAPDYSILVSGDVTDADGKPIPGLGVDWRGVGRLMEARGEGVLPGLVESIVAGAREIAKKGGHS